MTTRASPVAEINRDYFDAAYCRRSRLAEFGRIRLSFDQQYKLKVNWHVLGNPRYLASGRAIRRVLEVGFGFGLMLQKFRSDVSLCGTEISEHAVSRLSALFAREGRSASLCVNDSCSAFPFHGPFDVIVCSHVLEHVGDDTALLETFTSALAPDGVVLINVPINEQVADPKHVRRYDRRSLSESLERVGLEIVREFEADRWATVFAGRESRGLLQKAVRVLLALLPLSVGEGLADLCIRNCPYGQLAVIAKRRTFETR